MTLTFAGDTHPGRARSNNEDVVAWNPAHGLWLVADGMGGHASGEVASGIVRDTILAERADVRLEEAVRHAHQAILAAAEGDETRTGMGSTVVAVRITGTVGHVVWVGDSRAYLWRHRTLRRVTRDHSFVELLRERDDMSETDIRNHPNRNVVTQTLGLGDPTPSSVEVSLKHGDRLLLCSDGLNDELTDEEIANVIGACETPQEATRLLIDGALSKGGRDNVSVVVVAYHVDSRGLWQRGTALMRRWFSGRRDG